MAQPGQHRAGAEPAREGARMTIAVTGARAAGKPVNVVNAEALQKK